MYNGLAGHKQSSKEKDSLIKSYANQAATNANFKMKSTGNIKNF